jgi:uncharacterized phiE125 gp8 family phage protein
MQENYKQTVAPTLSVVSLDEAKDHCAVAGTDHDAYLSALIQRATGVVEGRTSRQLLPATWTLTLERFPCEIELRKPPVTAVSSIQYIDTAGDTQTLSSDDYQTDLSSNDAPARIKPAYSLSWPTTRSGTYGAVVVTFTAGYASASAVPSILKHAILFLVAHWFSMREAVTEGSASEIPQGLEMLLGLGQWGAY